MLNNKDECACGPAQIQYWMPKAVQTDYEDGQWDERHPLNPNQDATTFEFKYQGDGELYVDLSETYAFIEVGVNKVDGTAKGADEEIALSQNTLYSMFSQVVLSFNGVDVTTSNNTFHMKSYIEQLLSFGSQSANQVGMSGWVKDTPEKIDVADATSAGYKARKAWTAETKKACFIGKLNLGLTNADQLIPNGIDIRFRFTKNKETLLLQQPATNTTAYKTVVTKFALYIRRIKLSAQALVEQAKLFNSHGPATIHIKDSEVRAYAIPQGMRNHKIENLCEGQLPEQVFIGFVGNDAYNGHTLKRFYNFQHFNINFLQLKRNGVQHPATPFKPNFGAGGNRLREYHSLYVATGKLNSEDSLPFSYGDYSKGYTLFGFNFNPTLCNSELGQSRSNGSMSLEVNFSEDLTAPINAIVYMVFDRKLKIDKNRTTLPDFAP